MNWKGIGIGGTTLAMAGVLSIIPLPTHPTVLAAKQAATTIHTGPKWGSRTLASIAEEMAKSAHDMNPSSAVYFVANRGQGNVATSRDRVDSGARPVDVVVMRGGFSNPKWLTAPVGAPDAKGNTLVVIVNAKTGGVVDMGMMTQDAAQISSMKEKLTVLSTPHPLTVRQHA